MGGPRSMLFRNHTHSIDLVIFLADSEPLWVWSELEPGFEDYGIEYAGDGGNDPATEPGGNYYIVYRQWRPRIPDRVQGHGRPRHGGDADRQRTAASSSTSRGSASIRSSTRTSGPSPASRRSGRSRPSGRSPGCRPGLQDLIDSIDEGRPTVQPARAARPTVALIQAILMSQARGNVKVMLEELARVHDAGALVADHSSRGTAPCVSPRSAVPMGHPTIRCGHR